LPFVGSIGSLNPAELAAFPASLLISSPFPAALRALARLSPQRLSSRRPLSCSPLCYRNWHWPDRERPVVAPQRSDPAASGSPRAPPSRHLEEFSVALWFAGTPQSGGCSRPTASEAVLAPGASLQRYCGCRYHSADHLRFSTRHGGVLHPQETPWPSFLRSDHLQTIYPWVTFLYELTGSRLASSG